MSDATWSDPAPSRRARKGSWASIRWVPVPLDSPATEVLERTLRAQLTPDVGDVLAARFRAEPLDGTLRWFLGRDRLEEYELARVLLADPRVRRVVDPQDRGDTTRGPEQLDLRRIDVDDFRRELAEVVHSGYVYRSGRPSPDVVGKAERLAHDVVHELVLDRDRAVRVFHDHTQWCHWFGGLGFNWTYLLIAPALGEVTLLWVTDED